MFFVSVRLVDSVFCECEAGGQCFCECEAGGQCHVSVSVTECEASGCHLSVSVTECEAGG